MAWFRNVRGINISVCESNVIFCPICGCAAEVLVLIDFEGTMSDELTVKMGDVLKNVTKATEEGWLVGELNGKRGIFPSNFVKVGQQAAGRFTLPLSRVQTQPALSSNSRRYQFI